MLSHVKEMVDKYNNKVSGVTRDFCHNCRKYIYHIPTCCMKTPNFDESVFYVPEKAYKFMQQFRVETKSEVSDAQIELLLFELNKIWFEKEKETVGLLKKSNSEKFNAQKRFFDAQKSFDDKNIETNFNRMKKDFKDL